MTQEQRAQLNILEQIKRESTTAGRMAQLHGRERVEEWAQRAHILSLTLAPKLRQDAQAAIQRGRAAAGCSSPVDGPHNRRPGVYYRDAAGGVRSC